MTFEARGGAAACSPEVTESQRSDTAATPVRGEDLLFASVGQRLRGVKRHVLRLGRPDDALGHGITELVFDDGALVIRPGPHEDHLVVEHGPMDASNLAPQYWKPVDITRDLIAGDADLVRAIAAFTDGWEDVALVFELESGRRFSIVLREMDVRIAKGLEPFESDPDGTLPVLRRRVAYGEALSDGQPRCHQRVDGMSD